MNHIYDQTNDNHNDDNSDGDSANIKDIAFKVCLDAKDKPAAKPTSDEVQRKKACGASADDCQVNRNM